MQNAADAIARVMKVTRSAVEGIYFLESPESETCAVDFRGVKDAREAMGPWKSRGSRGRSAVSSGRPAGRGAVEADRCGVQADGRRAEPHLRVEVGAKDIDYREITAAPSKPQELVYGVRIDDLAVEPKGLKISLSNRVEMPYVVKGFENEDKSKPSETPPGGPGLFRPKYDKKKTPPEEAPVPFVVLRSIEIDPDYLAAWPPESWETDVGELIDDAGSAERLLSVWMERAWRRPVSSAERERFLGLYPTLRT